MIELKPCPFCGEKDVNKIITKGMNERFFIHHYDDVFDIKSSVGFDSIEEAKDAWNRRVDNA